MSNERGLHRQGRAILLLVGFAVLIAGLGLRAPWPPDEPRFALIARDMADNAQWLFPTVGGVLYPDKPPLFFWIVASLYHVVRSIDIALLLPGLVSGLLVLGLVEDLGRRLGNARSGLWAGALLLATIQFPLQMRAGQIDGLLCLWTTLALYGFCRHLLLGPDWRWYGFGGIAAGLGILTKGVGFLPYLVLLPYAFASWRGWLPPRAGHPARWLLAPVASIVVVGLWLVPMLISVATADDAALQTYRDDILLRQTVTRYADSWGHIKPPWYLLTHAVPWLWLPGILLLPWLLPAWRKDLARRQTTVLLLGGWILLVLLFFSLSPGKRSVYILPALPAFALLAGLHAEALVARSGVRRILRGFALAVAMLLLGIAAWFLFDPARGAHWITDPAAVVGAAVGIAITAAAMLVPLSISRQGSLAGVAAALVLFWIGFGVLVAPALDAERSGAQLMRMVDARLVREREIGLVDWPEQFLLQTQRPIYHFGYRRQPEAEIREAVAWVSAAPGRVLLLPAPLAETCFDAEQISVVGRAHRRTWVLAGADAVTGVCHPVHARVYRYQPPRVADY